MKPLAKFIGAALVGALALLAAPTAQAQVGVNINIGTPGWGPQVPYGTQYYYIPEIDGYYDLYSQQYIVFQDGYWVPLPQLYGYDPYQFHPVVIQYRGREPWLQSSYYHQRYAYQPYRNYGRGGYGNGYYSNGYGYGNYPSSGGYYGGSRNGYNDRNRNNGSYGNAGYNNGPRGSQPQPGGGSYGGNNNNGGPRGGYGGQPQQPQPPQPSGNGGYGGGPGSGPGNSGQGNNGHGQGGGGRHGRD